jgi:hypothetical protein
METYRTTKRTITTKFHYRGTNITGFITSVYGPNIPQQKQQFLEEIHYTSTLVDVACWIVGGDFNMITSLSEKNGGLRRLEKDSLSFCQTIQDLKLVDLETNNGIYNWNNKRGAKKQIASRLDRYLL